MNRSLIAGAALASLLLGACATTQAPPQELVAARSVVRTAELDPAVLSMAPLELKKATDTLNRANALLAKGEAQADVASAAQIASQQAKTAMAVAQAKTNDAAIASADVERERARADIRTAEAQRALALANTAQNQAALAQAQAQAARLQSANAEQRATGAEAQAAAAQKQNAELQQQLTELQAQQTERGMLVTLGDVLFEFGRADVKPGAENALRKLADFLQKNPARRVLIEGHTDSVGSAAANNLLSERRAQAVAGALQRLGVPAARVTTVGYGKDYPIADNTTDTNRALNRRVEVYIADNDQPVRQRR